MQKCFANSKKMFAFCELIVLRSNFYLLIRTLILLSLDRAYSVLSLVPPFCPCLETMLFLEGSVSFLLYPGVLHVPAGNNLGQKSIRRSDAAHANTNLKTRKNPKKTLYFEESSQTACKSY